MTTHPYIIDQIAQGRGKRLEVVDPGKRQFDQRWLQDLLTRCPELLPTAEIEPVFHPLMAIGREVPVFQERIDVLCISPDGYPVIIDTKLWRNPEARQQVFSQVLDMAFAFSRWDVDQIEAQTEHFTTVCHGKCVAFRDLVEKEFGDLGMKYEEFRNNIEKNLELGRFLVAFVADKIHASSYDVLNELNKYPGLGLQLALIELECFSVERGKHRSLLIVPRIAKKTEILERSVVEVKVYQERGPEVVIRQEKKNGNGRDVTLTETEFWDRLRLQAPKNYRLVKDLHDELQEEPLVEVGTGTNGLIFRKIVPLSGRKVSLFFIGTDSSINVQPQVPFRQCESLGLESSIAKEFRDGIRGVLNGFKAPVDQVDMSSFLKVILDFMEQIDQQAEVL